MKKLVTLASDIRVHALLCCSATVFLTACGGGSSDTSQPTKTAAYWLDSTTQQSGAPATDPTVTANPAAVATPISATDPTRLMTPTEVAVSASIYNLYVSTTGSDSNPGSASSPFRTITRAASLAKPSTTVHVAAGTYRENVATNTSGTSTGRIVYLSDTKWGAKIIGSGTEAMWTNNGNYIDIRGFDISGSGRLGILNYASNTIIATNHVHNLTVTGGCTGSGGAGIDNANYSAADDDIVNNVVHDIGVPGKCNEVQGIYTANLRGKIYNNIVYRVSSWGIQLWHAATNVTIANNTVFANGGNGMGGGMMIGAGDAPGGIVVDYTTVTNNIIYNNPASGIREYCYSGYNCIGSHNTIANNLVYGNGTNITLLAGTHTGTIVADPQFVNYLANGAGNYRLKSTSPAVNRGLSTPAPGYDIDLTARPLGAANDIGAYESF